MGPSAFLAGAAFGEHRCEVGRDRHVLRYRGAEVGADFAGQAVAEGGRGVLAEFVDTAQVLADGQGQVVGQCGNLLGGGPSGERWRHVDGTGDLLAWDAFPRPIEKWFEEADDPELERWRAAETLRPRLFDGRPLRRVTDGSLAEPVPVLHRQQDEYCEWFAHRDDG